MAQIQFERRMTENERHDEIMEFVKLNPKRTKAQVMRFMKDNDVSEPTTFKDITYLVGKGRLLVLKDKPNSQTHYLIVNDDNEFNVLENHIKETCLHLERSINKWDKAKEHLSTDYILLEQLIYFSEMSGLANRISAIEPKDKRDALYPRLIQALELSHELNSLIVPFLYPRVDEFFEEAEIATTDKKALKNLAAMKKAYEDIKKYFFKRED
jgi:hypothetical protein